MSLVDSSEHSLLGPLRHFRNLEFSHRKDDLQVFKACGRSVESRSRDRGLS